MQTEKAMWRCRAKLFKYFEDITPFRGREKEFYNLFKPYAVKEIDGNCLLNTGINELWETVEGTNTDHLDNTNARIGVGDSSTAAAATQTDLQAAVNKTYKAMEATYPTVGSDQEIVLKSSFGATDANYAWEEWVVKNNATSVCLNRKVESLGTKSGGTWTLEVSITLS